MANLRKVIYINEEDYSTLINGDSLVIDGTTYTYEENALYVIKNVGPPEYAETAGYATNAGTSLVAVTDASGNNIAATYGKKPLIIEVEDGDTEVPSGTFDSITGAINNGSRVIIKFISGDEYNTDIYYLPLTLYILCYTFEALIYKKYIWIEIDRYNNVSINNYNVSDDANVIHLNTTETITGNKTFSGTVSLGSNATATTPAATDNDTSVATTAFVHNVVNAEQVQADWNLTTTTAKDYIKNKPNITKTSNGNWDFLNINEEIINLNTSYAAYYNNKEIAVKDDIPSEIITGQIVGRMHRDNVSGTGNLTIAGASGEGFSPNGITTAGKYVVAVYSWSDTKTFGYNISFGSNSYTLSTTDGTISDKRELTVSAGALWSGSVTTAVSAGTTIIVEIYKAEKTTQVLSVGTVALTNLYNDLDGKPTISDSTSSTSSTDIASSKAVKLAYDHGGVQSVNGQTGAVNVNIPIINAVTETYSSTAADTTTPFSASIWRVDLSNKITELYTGLTILIKVPVAGNGTYGTLLRIDGTDSAGDTSENLYPVCANVTTMISTRYAVGCIIPLTFDATQAGQTLYYNSASAYTTTASGTGWTKPGCWKIADYSTGDTTTGREGYYYMRPYAGQAVYRYKYLMEGADGRLYPIVTTNQTSGTSVTKTPTTVGLRPWKIWYYNHTDTVSAGAAFGALRVYPELYTTTATYNFNASTGTYAWIFLLGSYNKDTDLFTLDTGNNYYKFVRYNAAINWASSLTAGKYYILLGSSYSTTNYVLLYNVNPFYYFNGTNLIPVTTKIALDSGPVTSVNGLTGDITIEVSEGELSENYATSELENENLMLAAGDTFETAFSKVEKAIIDNEETVAGALNDLNERLLDIDVPSSVSDLTDDIGIVKSVTVNGNNYTPTDGIVNLGTITGTGTGEANIIESVKVNGTALTVTNKTVDITAVPASIVTADSTHRFVTDSEKTTWNAGQANVIETIKVNSIALTPDANKAVDISVPYTMYVTVTENNGTYTADKTYNEIRNAVIAGTDVIVKYFERRAYFQYTVACYSDDWICFDNTDYMGNGTIFIKEFIVKDSGWTYYEHYKNIPTKTSDLTNDSNFTTLSEVTLTIVNSAPTTLDTLNELAAALGNDANFATTVATQIGQKYTKPNTGIPASDLTSAVQTSLGKADIAIQGVKVNGTSVTPDSNKIVDITIPEGELSTNYEPSSLNNEDLELATGDTYEEAFAKLEKTINNNETITAAALVDLSENKQNVLISGTNIKTINNLSLLDNGNITINETEIITVSYTGSLGGVLTLSRNIYNEVHTAYSEGKLIDVKLYNGNDIDGISSFDVIINKVYKNNEFVDEYIGYSLCYSSFIYMVITSSECLCMSSGLVGIDGATFTGNIYMNNSDISLNSGSSLVIQDWQQIVNDSTGDTLNAVLSDKQDTLISGTNIKTINNNSLLGNGNISVGTYSKPSGGIPKTDLASAVQTSLGLADTALQSYTETDPTVPAWAKQSTKPSYTAAEVGALPDTTVIPAAPGTLNTTATTAQSTSSSEALSGNITLHKVAKTGTYNDLIGKPTIPEVPVKAITQSKERYILPTDNGINADSFGRSTTHCIKFKDDGSVNISTKNGYSVTVNNNEVALKSDIPSAVTESTVSGWGFTKNTGTITGITMNGASKGTSGVVDLGTVLTSFTETDPTVPAWAKASTKPTYTAAEVGALPDTTVIPTVNNATLTIQKNGTTVNTFTANASSNVTANILVNELPTVSSSDNGKVLMVVNGAWAAVTPVTVYTGTSTPNNSLGNNGDLYVLTS